MSADFFFQADSGKARPDLIPNSAWVGGNGFLQRGFGNPTSGTTGTWSWWEKNGARQAQKTYQTILFCDRNAGEMWRQTHDNPQHVWTESYFYSGNHINGWSTWQNVRDNTGWRHIMIVYDTSNGNAGDRIRWYVNGERAPKRNGADLSQNINMLFGQNNNHWIARQNTDHNNGWIGHLAQFAYVDGQALNPDKFGVFTDSGAWAPIKSPDVTNWGNNGFYLPFTDGNNMGRDDSGNGNNWSATNVELSEDSPSKNLNVFMPDVPTGNNTFSKGRLVFNGDNSTAGTVGVHTRTGGKWYWEVRQTAQPSGIPVPNIGVCNSDINGLNEQYMRGDGSGSWVIRGYNPNGKKRHNGSESDYAGTWRDNWYYIGVKLDLDNRQLSFTFNGADQGVAFSNLPDGFYIPEMAFTGGTAGMEFFPNATPPSGYKNLQYANITNEVDDPGSYFKVHAYTGNGGTQSVSGVGFSPDLVWIKNKTSNSANHYWYDTARGAAKTISSNLGDAEVLNKTGGWLQSFDGDGFTVNGNGNNVNANNDPYIAYCFKKKAGFFDIVTYTGNNSNRTISHNLGVKPAYMIIKNLSDNQPWGVYHRVQGAGWCGFLNQNGSWDQNSNYWNNTEPTASNFSLGSAGNLNKVNDKFVAYLFADCPGLCQVGQYRGNGWSNGPVCATSFHPGFFLLKRRDTNADWMMYDSVRRNYNLNTAKFSANYFSQNEEPGDVGFDFRANGFKYAGGNGGVGDRNGNGGHFLWIAFGDEAGGSVQSYPPNAV